MNYLLGEILLRRPEPSDLDALYQFKNDPEIAAMLGGFTTGYAAQDLRDWLEYHRKKADEWLMTVAVADDNRCIGHVGLYNIDARVRQAEFAILLGDRAWWGKGLGRICTRFAIDYGFSQLNLNRIYLSALATNTRAIRLYEGLGFRHEGLQRQAQFKDGAYVDVTLMGLLRAEWVSHAPASDAPAPDAPAPDAPASDAAPSAGQTT